MKAVNILLKIVIIIISLPIAVFLKFQPMWYPTPAGEIYEELYSVYDTNVSTYLFSDKKNKLLVDNSNGL
jgi:hypothetical protein